MPRSTDIDLQQAFTHTRYLVQHTTGVLTILVDQPPPALLQEAAWLIITADNPQAQQINARENEHRRAALQLSLQQLTLPMLATRHVDPTGTWPDEHGWLVMSLPGADQVQWLTTQMISRGHSFGQRALLAYMPAADADADPAAVKLLWL